MSTPAEVKVLAENYVCTKRKQTNIADRKQFVNVQEPYESCKLPDRYGDEYRKLILANRLIHHKQFPFIGWNFLEFEDKDDADKSLFPLKTFPNLGPKDCRVTHLAWMSHLKHNLVISYESATCAAHSQWREGYIIMFYPLVNTTYDHVFSFASGVRHFDLAPEPINRGLMLVALEDGNVQLVKLPFADVIQSTSEDNKHACSVVQVQWLLDWSGERKYQRFISCSVDGDVKLWCNRPLLGFTVYRTFRINTPSSRPPPAHRNITCLGCHFYDRSIIYIGCDNGQIYKYSDTRNTYECKLHAHAGIVTVITVNKFNRDVFLSGGADGMVKLWRGNSPTPLWGYYLINPISDIKWSPYTSYVWSAVTRDNFVHIYNIEKDFRDPLTSQNILPSSSCVKVDFHPSRNVLIIVDTYCNLFAYKISRLVTEPEIVHQQETWDPRQPPEVEDGLSVKDQRERLRTVLDKIETLVKCCRRIKIMRPC